MQAGTVIPAALVTGIRSDLPGQITALVTENVYDTPTGHSLLVPQGSRLIGVYDSQVAFGQSRVLLVWTRLITPNGRSIVLERQLGADAAGYSGLEDEVDNHWGALFRVALLSTLLGVGSELSSGSTSSGANGDIVQAIRRGASDSVNQTGRQVVRRNLNIQPTLTIRPGFPVRVIVNRDLVLEPMADEEIHMAKLSAIADDKSVKLSVEVPATPHRDLVAYAEVLAWEPPAIPGRFTMFQPLYECSRDRRRWGSGCAPCDAVKTLSVIHVSLELEQLQQAANLDALRSG